MLLYCVLSEPHGSFLIAKKTEILPKCDDLIDCGLVLVEPLERGGVNREGKKISS